MLGTEFHKISKDFFHFLEEQGFKKKRSKSVWSRKLADSLSVEFEIRLDRNGWNEHLGSSFVYVIALTYNNVRQYSATRQYRLYELKEYDSNLIERANVIMSQVASKIRSYENCEQDDYYVYLKSGWSPKKILEYDTQWYHFYDQEDILSWYSATERSLALAIKQYEKEINIDFVQESGSQQRPQKATFYINDSDSRLEIKE